MTLKLSKEAIDIGIVTNDVEPMLAFYRDLLGFAEDCRLPFTYDGVVIKLLCGMTFLKLVAPTTKTDTSPKQGLMAEATGHRYVTIWVSNLKGIMRNCEVAGIKIHQSY